MNKTVMALVVALVTLAGDVRAATYEIGKGSQVSFVAKITASSFVAKSTEVSGTVEVDEGSGVVKSATVRVKADSLSTGMSMRDEHMNDNYLHTATYPHLIFEVAEGTSAIALDKMSVLEGFFTIRGQRKAAKVKVKVQEMNGGEIVLISKFKINITDFGIAQPKFMVVKMETVVQVSLKLVLQTKAD